MKEMEDFCKSNESPSTQSNTSPTALVSQSTMYIYRAGDVVTQCLYWKFAQYWPCCSSAASLSYLFLGLKPMQPFTIIGGFFLQHTF